MSPFEQDPNLYQGRTRVMRACARLRDLSVLAILILDLVGPAPPANAQDAFVLNGPQPKLESLLPRAPQAAQAQQANSADVNLAQRADPFVLNRHVPKLESLVARAQRHGIAPAQAVAAADPICDIFANGYDVTGATPCATCFDGVTDYDETDVDCGGAWCNSCADGKQCVSNSDCSSTLCNLGNHTCSPATCLDNVQDGSETDVDCGGPVCPTCADTKKCTANSDCTSGACDFVSGVCVASLCVDERHDGTETGVDCGGPVCSACANGQLCVMNSDCSSNWCNGGTCTNPVCNGVGCVYCSPINPDPICGTDSHCLPQPDTTSVCTFPAGSGTSGALCATDADCAGPLACINTGSAVTTCQNWCAYPSGTCPGFQTCTELNPPAYTGSAEWGVCI
jgi:hypothetical protein